MPCHYISMANIIRTDLQSSLGKSSRSGDLSELSNDIAINALSSLRVAALPK
jgi:hypothetical protein